MDYAEFLRLTRLYYGMTQTELAEALGFRQSTVSDIENKRNNPSDKFRSALARKFPTQGNTEFALFLIEMSNQRYEKKGR